MIVGKAFVVVGLVLLKTAGLVTGGVAGFALLASYIFPLPVGTIFTLANTPVIAFVSPPTFGKSDHLARLTNESSRCTAACDRHASRACPLTR
ncbi:YitT family protein [Paraburkholderia sp. XV]|uniref:YitT family protein n=1 Tax=Paraburkholderia sp. XV TaxID=2831520 RepID=UPI001CD3B4C6|nr:YitT family protein [Paraburkholderia sp. XV]